MKKGMLKILALALCLLMAFFAFGCTEKAAEGGEGETGGSEKTDIFSVKYNGTTISLGGKADPVLNSLGTPTSSQSTGNCGGLGETVRYDYNALVIVVVEYEDGAVIDKIELRNDAVTTSKGVYIGAAKNAVTDAYGAPDREVSGNLVYVDGNKQMVFGIKDSTVYGITLSID